MTIQLHKLTDEPEPYEGAIPADFLDWDAFKPTSPVRYWFDAWMQDGQIYVCGRVECEGLIDCARCIDPLEHKVVIPDFAGAFDIPENGELDLTPTLREEILIGLPAFKKCQLDDGDRCPLTGKFWGDVASAAPGPPLANLWAELDKLDIGETKQKKNGPEPGPAKKGRAKKKK